MNKPKRQHYIPRSYLNKFSTEFENDKDEMHIQMPAPKSSFRMKDAIPASLKIKKMIQMKDSSWL